MGIICFKIKYVFFRFVCFGFFVHLFVFSQTSTADINPSESVDDNIGFGASRVGTSKGNPPNPDTNISTLTSPADKRRAPAKTGSPARPVLIYGIQTDFRLTVGGETQYNGLFNALAADGLDFRLRIRSMRRSLRYFAKNMSSCIFPSNIKLMHSARDGKLPQKLIMSDAVDTFNIKVFTANGDSRSESLEELNGKRLAYWGKSMLAPMINKLNFFEEPTHNESVRLKMLGAGRVDAIIAPDRDVYITARALGIPATSFDSGLIVWGNLDSTVVCHDSLKTRAFLAELDEKLIKLKSNGRLDVILAMESAPAI